MSKPAIWVMLALLGLLAAPHARAQSNLDIARQRLLCAQMGNDLTSPTGAMLYRRCLAQVPGTTGATTGTVPQLVGPIPQLVKPSTGPLITPGPALITPLGGRPAAPARDGCMQGYVWREVTAADHVCVSPAMRTQVRRDNAAARSRVNPDNHDYGPDTCRYGYVWREAFPADHVCVTPDMRSQARADNAQAGARVAR